MAWFRFTEQIVIPALVIALLVGGIAGILLGCALVFRSAATLNFIARMNRWISTGQALKPLDEPRDIEPGPRLRRPWVGGFLALGSAFVLYFLLVRLQLPRGTSAAPPRSGSHWSSWETLMARRVGAVGRRVVPGPRCTRRLLAWAVVAMARFEARMNRWHSARRLIAADEIARFPLEPLVEAHPRAAGWIIATASLLVTLAMAALLVTRLH